MVRHLDAQPSARLERRIDRLARELVDQHPALTVPDELRPLMPERLAPGHAVHLDDLTGVPYLDTEVDKSFLQERARLRADDLDSVVTCLKPPHPWETYYRDRLGLGAPTWLHAETPDSAEAVACATWADRAVRRELVRAIRHDEIRYVHPHMGSAPVWRLADLLRRSARRPLYVMAPPPGLTALVNNKLAFADIVTRLLGPQFTPPTQQASNFAHLSGLVAELAPHVRTIVIKLPDSMAAGGTLLIEAGEIRGRSVAAIREDLQSRFEGLTWEGASPLLVGSWETGVLSSPSAQIWIPPPADGPPVIEGIFEQLLLGAHAEFVGSQAAELPAHIFAMIGEPALGLALLFQRLGYVGRCSFDMLVVGPTLASARVEFVECNGRWGGTSLPMTLMNRLFGDWATQPYVATIIAAPGVDAVSLGCLLEEFAPLLYDARTGEGRVLFYSGVRLRITSAINVIVLGPTLEAARALVATVVRPRVLSLARSVVANH